jgi:hypothetical protein
VPWWVVLADCAFVLVATDVATTSGGMTMKTLVATMFVFGVSACGLDGETVSGNEAAIDVGGAEEMSKPPVQELAMAELDLAARTKIQEKIAEKIAANPGAEAAPRHAVCGQVGPNLENFLSLDSSAPLALNQRTGSSTGCPIVGSLIPSDDNIYFCFTFGNDGFTWTYLRNLATNVRGWVRDDGLRDFGSFVHCGF